MKQLTKEDIQKFPITCAGRMLGKQLSNQVVQELLQYKILEEGLEISFSMLLRLLNQEPVWCKPPHKDQIYEMTPFVNTDHFELHYFSACALFQTGSNTYHFKDHGVTWWFKEELEEVSI